MSKSWYAIKNAAEGDSAEVFIYEEIGLFGITANAFVRDLKDLAGRPLDVHINSPGGEVFEGYAIYNALLSHDAPVTTYVDGLGASIASVISQAGSRRVISKLASMMIHEPKQFVAGDAERIAKYAEQLDQLGAQVAGVYADRSAADDVDAWRERMKVETWYTAEEAVEAGLADEVIEAASLQAAAKAEWLERWHAPEKVRKAQASIETEDPPVDPETEGEMADIETIINVLGLEAGSDAEAAVAAIEALKAQNALLQETMKADAPEKEAVAQMRTDLQSAQQRLLEMDAEHNRNTLQLREKVRTMEAEARVDKAIAQGRVTPANRDYALRVAISETEEGWNNFVRTLPSVNLKELGTAVGFDNEAYEPTQEEIAIARQMGQWDDADPGASRVALMRAKGAKIPAEK